MKFRRIEITIHEDLTSTVKYTNGDDAEEPGPANQDANRELINEFIENSYKYFVRTKQSINNKLTQGPRHEKRLHMIEPRARFYINQSSSNSTDDDEENDNEKVIMDGIVTETTWMNPKTETPAITSTTNNELDTPHNELSDIHISKNQAYSLKTPTKRRIPPFTEENNKSPNLSKKITFEPDPRSNITLPSTFWKTMTYSPPYEPYCNKNVAELLKGLSPILNTYEQNRAVFSPRYSPPYAPTLSDNEDEALDNISPTMKTYEQKRATFSPRYNTIKTTLFNIPKQEPTPKSSSNKPMRTRKYTPRKLFASPGVTLRQKRLNQNLSPKTPPMKHSTRTKYNSNNSPEFSPIVTLMSKMSPDTLALFLSPPKTSLGERPQTLYLKSNFTPKQNSPTKFTTLRTAPSSNETRWKEFLDSFSPIRS